MKEGINDEVDDQNRRNLIEENEKNLNDDDADSTEVEDKEENVTTDSESNTIAKNDDNLIEICEGKEMNDERVGKDVSSVEEAEMSSRPSSESINYNDDLVGEFYASTCSGGIFENTEEIITEDSIVWVNTNKTNWKR